MTVYYTAPKENCTEMFLEHDSLFYYTQGKLFCNIFQDMIVYYNTLEENCTVHSQKIPFCLYWQKKMFCSNYCFHDESQTPYIITTNYFNTIKFCT